MTRRTIDLLLSWTGLVVAIVLLAVGGLLLWGSSFVRRPGTRTAVGAADLLPAGEQPVGAGTQFADVREYGGEQLLTGPQAEAYANDFIAVHLEDVADGMTYAEVSGAALADPDNEQLQEQAQTLFRGTTLRGLLLNAYAFSTVGQMRVRGRHRNPDRRRRAGAPVGARLPAREQAASRRAAGGPAPGRPRPSPRPRRRPTIPARLRKRPRRPRGAARAGRPGGCRATAVRSGATRSCTGARGRRVRPGV